MKLDNDEDVVNTGGGRWTGKDDGCAGGIVKAMYDKSTILGMIQLFVLRTQSFLFCNTSITCFLRQGYWSVSSEWQIDC